MRMSRLHEHPGHPSDLGSQSPHRSRVLGVEVEWGRQAERAHGRTGAGPTASSAPNSQSGEEPAARLRGSWRVVGAQYD